jgi:hypothetical protein
MKINHVGEHVYCENDLADLIMQGHDLCSLSNVVVDHSVDLDVLINLLEDPKQLTTWTRPADPGVDRVDYDLELQRQWLMPDGYRDLDIARMVLESCSSDAELQRAGQELLMFQERNMFDLLRYLVYLVDVMRSNNIIWGVGRGSCVASFVLYKIGVHRVNSLYYDLDPAEFLR